MEQIWQWGISVIITVQKIRSPFFDSFFSLISFCGTMIFYMALLPFIYWCFNKKYASRIFILFFVSSWFNSILKNIINHPRPYNLNESVKIGKTGGPGLPSGHAQQSLVVWGSISLWLKNKFFTYFSVVFILLIGFSRIYLGVHFPTDVLGAWIVGAVVLFVLWHFLDRIEMFLLQFSPVFLAITAIIIPALFSVIAATKSSVMPMGGLSGFCVGIILEKKYVNFRPAANLISGSVRFFCGMVILLILFFAEKYMFTKSTPHYMFFVFIHSWILCLWISFGAPLLFKKFRM